MDSRARISAFVVVAALLLGAALATHFVPSASAAAGQRVQYRVLKLHVSEQEIERQLNALGDDGWQLVAVHGTPPLAVLQK